MEIAQEVFERLLVAKELLERIRFLPIARPDRLTLARHILAAHDAAELATAAITHHLDALPHQEKIYLMDYIAAIKEKLGESVPGRDYFSKLNKVRIGIKHNGIFPDPQQWYRVGEHTFNYVSSWCEKYLGIILDDLDESALIFNTKVKEHLDSAKEAFGRKKYQEVLENLAFAMNALFESNQALRNLAVGQPHPEDAIKLSAFGVHANDFIALQEFLPSLIHKSDRTLQVRWEQEKYGHPANWVRSAAEFCIKTFVHVALRIQDAEWIPGAIDFGLVYEHKITALADGVQIVEERRKNILDRVERFVVRTLHKGESIRGHVSRKQVDFLSWVGDKEHKPTLSIFILEEKLFGEVEADKVKVTCVPREAIHEYFPDLPEFDYNPLKPY